MDQVILGMASQIAEKDDHIMASDLRGMVSVQVQTFIVFIFKIVFFQISFSVRYIFLEEIWELYL